MIRRVVASQPLRAALLASVLPMLLFAPLEADVVLLYSDCAGDVYLRRVEAADLRAWPLGRFPLGPCCESEQTCGAEDQVNGAPCGCDCGQPVVVIATGIFTATRPGDKSAVSHERPPQRLCSARVTADAATAVAKRLRCAATRGSPRWPGEGASAVLSRNHVLLL
jgi:hypothetical protein